MKKIVIEGRIPSKKNAKVSIVRNGRLFIIPNNQFRKWHEKAVFDLKAKGIKLITGIKYIEIVLYAPDKRRSDLTNKVESLMDLLVDVNILEDDNWFIVDDLRLKFGGVDRENPRAEIFIYHDSKRSSDKIS